MTFAIRGVPPAPFAGLAELSDADLAARRAVRVTADAKPGFPCRVTLQDADPGESLLLINYQHQPAATPYQSSHAIFVREGASEAACFVDEVPDSLAVRLLSVRAFDEAGMMVDARCLEGARLSETIAVMLGDPRVA